MVKSTQTVRGRVYTAMEKCTSDIGEQLHTYIDDSERVPDSQSPLPFSFSIFSSEGSAKLPLQNAP